MMNGARSIFRTAGSLWFAAVLLALLMVAMACATIFESTRGTEQALALFYHAWWFKLLLVLLAVNVLVAVVLRYPFSKRQIGFVLTHAGILLTLAGAWVTDQFAINGQVGIAEGQTVKRFRRHGREVLGVTNKIDHARSTIDLDSSSFGGFDAVDRPADEELRLGDLRVEVVKYWPDMIWERTVLDDDPHLRPAVEVSLSATGLDDPTWVFVDQTSKLGTASATFRLIADHDELNRLLTEQPDEQAGSKSSVKIEFAGSTFDIPLADCIDKPIPLGDTGYTARVLRYLPHAVVGSDNKVTNASNDPVNPAIEVEIAGPAGSMKQIAFAKFPDFKSMHLKKQLEGLKVTFVASTGTTPRAPVEVLSGPDGDMHVRFFWTLAQVVSHKIDVGAPIETPWPGKKFALLRRFDHARIKWSPKLCNPIRKEREPALLLQLTAGEKPDRVWVHKYEPRSLEIAGTPYELIYGDKTARLGFDLKLNRFRVGYYPGGNKARSFESHITTTDPASGRVQDRIISMNNPYKHGGYTLYQSSYREGRGPTLSFLSVSWDPGLPIAFAGYIAVIVGMLVGLVIRMMDRRRKT